MAKLQGWFHKYNAWSFTKHRLWGQCKLAYYFSYIGTALENSTDYDVKELKNLKDLDSKFVVQGKLIHEIIENQIGQYHLGRGMDEAAARTHYTQRVETYRKNASRSLIEIRNGEAVSEAFFDRIREGGLDQLSMFFGVVWPQFADLIYLRHEQFDRFKVGNVEAIVKVDYATKTRDGIVVISDWKTGVDNAEYESDLQLGAYVIWATQQYGLPPAQIRSELIYLTTGAMRSYEFASERLVEIGDLIASDFRDMNQSYEIADFAPSPEKRICISCPFATLCPHSVIHNDN